MLWIIGWVMLWFRPAWGFLGIFTLGLAVLNLIFGYMRNSGAPEAEGLSPGWIAAATLIDSAISVAIFAAIGAVIVLFRSRKAKHQEDEVDAELARVRAEIAARDGTTPPPA